MANRTGEIALACVLTACTPATAAPPLTGIARSIDGDSLYVGNTEVRLFGIDAPEWDQSCQRGRLEWSCGHEAARQLMKLVTGRQASCVRVDTDEHGRTVARCSVGGVDVNRAMVERGYAVAYRHYSIDYVAAEQIAKAYKRGLWAGTFELPSQYRHERQAQEPHSTPRSTRVQARTSKQGCVIKGNRGPHGWIYHLPGMPYYGQTRPEEIFCSEAAAQAAGYRRAVVK